MSPSPKVPEEKKLDDDNSSNDDLSHPQFHIQHEYIASTDESNSDDDNTNQSYENFNGYCLLPQETNINQQEKQSENKNEDEDESGDIDILNIAINNFQYLLQS